MKKTIHSVYPVKDKIEIVVVGGPNPVRDEILCDERIWGQRVELRYVETSEELESECGRVSPPDLLVYEYITMPNSSFRKFNKVLKQLEIEFPILLLVRNRVPAEVNFLTQRDNVFCASFSHNNKKHLLCTVSRVRSSINLIRKTQKEKAIRNFIEGLYDWAIEKEKRDFHSNVRELLRKIGFFYGFEIVSILQQSRGKPLFIHRNVDTIFCPLLVGSSSERRICAEIANGSALYLPIRFFRDTDFVFDATDENVQYLVSMVRGANTCGLCHTYGYGSMIFLPFKVEEENWLLLVCDKVPGKANEEIYQGIKSIIPVISNIISLWRARSAECKLLDLYNSALASGRIGIWEYEIDTRKIISIGLKSLFPYLNVPGELNEWWQYIHPEDRMIFWNAVKPCLKGLTNSFAVDHRLLLPGDRVIWIRTIGECKEKRGVEPTRLIGIGMDITGFMQEEMELRGLRENLRVASEVGNIGLWSWEISKNIYYINEPGITIFGMERKKSYTLEDWLKSIHDEYRDEVQLEIGRALSQGQNGVINIEYQIVDKDGISKWIHTFGRVSECDSGGNPRVLSGTHIDITTRKMMERHLMKELIVSSRYASLARSLLRVDNIEQIAKLILITNLEITESEICFVGYTVGEGLFHIIGLSKNREKIYEEDWKLEEMLREFEILEYPLKAEIPLVMNTTKEKEIRVFGNKKVDRLVFVPSMTPEKEIVFVMDLNSPEAYSSSDIESIEWLSSIFAQSYSRVKLEEANTEKTKELEKTVKELQSALATVKKLHGLLPICARCKRIRDDAGYWHEVEVYIRQHSEAEFTHGLCPQCAKELYGNFGNI